jgi:Na+/H+ antiporter NhaC
LRSTSARRAALGLALGLWLGLAAAPAAAQDLELGVAVDGAALSGTRLRLVVSVAGADAPLPIAVTADGRLLDTLDLGNGDNKVELANARLTSGRHTLSVRAGAAVAEASTYVLPAWLSILPPLIAIGLAVIFKDVLVALYLGVFSGTLCLFGLNPLTGLARTVDHFIVPAVTDTGQASILIFTLMLGGMVGLVTRSGGTQGIVEGLSRYATNVRRGQVATWLMGVLIFFDDYSNALVVGSMMRPLSDRLRISREKLAYIVDSTAAPVASVVPFSSWIGFEVGLIAAALTALNLPYNAYATFVASIPFRFYPIFALVLGFAIAITGRDFGPMLKAERRARSTGKLMDDGAVPLADYGAAQLAPPEGAPMRAMNAFLPILTIIVVTLVGLYLTGSSGLDRADYPALGDWIREVMGAADSYKALLWASLGGVLMAGVLPLVQRILDLRQTLEAMIEGFKSMLLALVVLTLAWSIGGVCTELHTADFLVRTTEGVLSPGLLPVIIFALSAVIAFATGSSWGTLSILMPLVIPIAHGIAGRAGLAVGAEGYTTLLVGTISSVLAGSVWGDHCSPISDTTILSSTASGCDHIAHVRTQMPYALFAGVVGMVVGDIPTAYGMSPWISLLLGTVVIVATVRWLGRPTSDPARP